MSPVERKVRQRDLGKVGRGGEEKGGLRESEGEREQAVLGGP